MRLARFFMFLPTLFALVACGQQGHWPQGMEAIHWDRDTCAQCGMVISDPRFAVEIRGGTNNAAFKFDDMGCLALWTQSQKHPWAQSAPVWVADFSSVKEQRDTLRWLDARTARYVKRISPMGGNFAATKATSEPSVDFNEALRQAGGGK